MSILEVDEFEQRIDAITGKIIGAAISVHRVLGPGLLESAYEECLCFELSQIGLRFERQVPLPVKYKGVKLTVVTKWTWLWKMRLLLR